MNGPEKSYEQRRNAATALRKSLSLSQYNLAVAAGITRERLNRFENSKTTFTKSELAHLERILAQLRDQRLTELLEAAS